MYNLGYLYCFLGGKFYIIMKKLCLIIHKYNDFKMFCLLLQNVWSEDVNANKFTLTFSCFLLLWFCGLIFLSPVFMHYKCLLFNPLFHVFQRSKITAKIASVNLPRRFWKLCSICFKQAGIARMVQFPPFDRCELVDQSRMFKEEACTQ
jgi:hypothetical protein